MNTTKTYAICWSITTALGFFTMGYWFACFNVFTTILHAQYVFHNKYVIADKDLFNSVSSGLIPFGAILGAAGANFLIKYGRRPALMSTSLLFTAACLLSTVFDLRAFIWARLFMGISVGAYTSICPLMIWEIAPKSLIGPLGVLPQLMAVIGLLTSFVLAFIVPYSGTEEALHSQTWKIIFVFPGLLTSFQFIMISYFFKYDTPKFYQLINDRENYVKSISLIYSSEEIVESVSRSDEATSNSSNDSKNELSWSQIISTPFRKALIVGLLLSFFHQATGISSVTFYSNEIFTNGKTGSEAEFFARLSTLIIGFVAILAAFVSLYASKSYGRKNILLVGEISMMLLLLGLYYFSLYENQLMIKIAIILFVFSFNSTFGCVLWPYASEILSSKGVTLVASLNMFFTLIFGCFGNLFFKYLTAPGVYFSLFVMQIVCILFVFQFMIETKDKTQRECESLYFPKDTQKYIQLTKV